MGSGSSTKGKPNKETNNDISDTVTSFYPSPLELQKLQENYASSLTSRPSPSPDGNVAPFPTPDKKCDVYKQSDVDNYVEHSCATQEFAEMKLPDLVSHLTKTSNNDIQRLRAIYKWLTIQNLDQYAITENPDPDSALYQLLLIRAKRRNFNHLFQLLSNVANIKSRLIEGTTRPPSYYYGGKLISGHVWCAVYVADAWRLVDVHSAMLYSTSTALYKSALYNNSGVIRDKKTHVDGKDEERTIGKNRSDLIDFFFLVDPYQLIYFNLPNESVWQLLPKPIADDVFPDLVVLNPDFFIEGVENVNETKGIVTTKEGQAAFRITFPEKHGLPLFYRIRKLTGNEYAHKTRESDFRDFCLLENEGSTKCLNVSLDRVGRYKIQFYVAGLGQPDSERRQICYYFLDVRVPDFQATPLPYNPRYEYGPGADTESFGIKALSHSRAIIRTSDGETVIEFACSELHGKHLRAELVSREIVEEDLKHCVLCTLSDDAFRSFIRLRQAGRYLYKLIVQDTKSGSSFNVCSYLIVASAASSKSEPFPDGVSGYIGDVSFIQPSWIKPVSHPSAFIDCDNSGELSIQMVTALSLDLQMQLELSDAKLVTGDLTEYTWFVHDSNKLIVQLTFPESGQYTLTIFAKPRGQQLMLTAVWIYVINVDTPQNEALPFPLVHINWSRSCDLRQPMSGYMLEENEVTFEARVHGAKDVAILTEMWACHSLKVDDDGWWRGSIKTGQHGSPLMLAAMLDDLQYTYLLEYQVLSGQEFQRLAKRQKEAVSLATKRQQEQEKRIKTEQEKAIRRQQQTANRITEQMAVFNRNQNMLLSQEDEYRRQELGMWEKTLDTISEMFVVKDSKDNDKEAVITQQIRELQETKDWNLTARRNIHKGMRTYLVRERLREGTKLADFEMLKSAVSAFLATGLEEQDHDLTKAKHTLEILQAKQDILEAMTQNNVHKIQECIDDIRSRGLYGSLQVIVQEAERRVTDLTKLDRLKLTVLGMDKNTMGEIRSYAHPPEGVHKVMQAALLLLGEDEYTTSEWSNCQKICSLVGRESLNRRILDLDIQNLNREITGRVKRILSNLELRQVQHISAGAAAFYVWALGTAEGIEKISASDEEEVTPAGVTRQREIFGKPPLDEREMTRFRAPSPQPDVKYQKQWIS